MVRCESDANKNKQNDEKDSPSTGLHIIAPLAATLPSAHDINHQRLVLGQTAAGRHGCCGVMSAGGRFFDLEWTRDGQHHFGPVFAVGCM